MLKNDTDSNSLLSGLGFLVPKFHRPVFIISAPRSGSTYFYHCIRKLEGVFSFGRENTPMWIRIFPYSRLAVKSDYVSPEECTQKASHAIQSFILLKGITHGFSLDDPNQKSPNLRVIATHLLARNPIRYMEKTIANCFHLEALEQLFPDAVYIHLVRDGRPTISSMMEGWDIFVKVGAGLSFPPDSTISHWSYALPPGWDGVVTRPLETICAWSWVEHNRYIVEKMQQDQTFSQKCLRVCYEDFLENPAQIISQVADFCDLVISDDCLQYIQAKPKSRTTVSAPEKDKWKRKNQAEIESILPVITPMMHQLGYTVND
ncbi:MAG: sulfotransferase family protein [Microcoleaceae cyanobacterium]